MDKVLILGASGFTGKHFQKYIHKNELDRDYQFIGVDRIKSLKSQFDFIETDLLDFDLLKKLIQNTRPDYIINLAGVFASASSEMLVRINALVSQAVFDSILAGRIKARKILLVGSAAEYGFQEKMPIKEDAPLNPINDYGLSKSLQTHIARYYFTNHGSNTCIARTFNIIGKGLSTSLSIGSFIEQVKKAKNGSIIKTGNISSRRDFLHIDDVIDAYWKILMEGKNGEIYNVCSGRSHSIKSILDRLICYSGKELTTEIEHERLKSSDIEDNFGSNEKPEDQSHSYFDKSMCKKSGYSQHSLLSGEH